MRICIVGCGYVGLELASQLADHNHDVTGVRRSESGLKTVESVSPNVDAVQADVTKPETLAALPDVDTVVFAASAGGRGADAARNVYVEGLKNVIEAYGTRQSSPDRLVYTSSTGVYGDHDGAWVDEETAIDPTTEKTRVLANAESVALEMTEDYGKSGTVVRFGGLYGPERYRLERYLKGPVTAGSLNMVHRVDAAGTIRYLLSEELAQNMVVLAVDDEPVDKHEFADWLAGECDVNPPEKQTVSQRMAIGNLSEAARRRLQTNKRCCNDRLKALGYEFRYPTFRQGYRSAIENYRSTEGA
ncbi:SDR family oxidoreductase [Halodesulfurarchaeum sp.]|uniref:SDR family oxidoreductase n=1 Tax=Halodesulfurarchaeum sp. TaxID=1980530 RepID=UPI002FC3471F